MLYDACARAVPDGSIHIPHVPHTIADGGVEFGVAELFARCANAIDAMHACAAERQLPIVAIAMTTFVANLIAVNADG